MKASEALEGARAILEKGWIQHSFSNETGCCAVGALLQTTDAYSGDGEKYLAGLAVRRLCYEHIEAVTCDPSITHWNDALGRTKEEVLEAFDKAVIIAKRHEEVAP